MSEHEVSRVLQASPSAVFGVAADAERLPEWLPTMDSAATLPDGEVHVEGDGGSGSYASDGFWQPSPDQNRIEWSSPSRGGEPSAYSAWLQVEDSGSGSEVVVHLSFTHDVPAGPVEGELSQALESLADLVES